jgi:hypothetical protein
MPLFDYVCENEHHFERFTKKRSFVPKCPTCGEEGEKVWLPSGRATGEGGNEYPKTTKDITGTEITLTDAAHERAVIAEHERKTGEKIRKRDDAAFLSKEHAGLDWKTGQPIYKEGSGAGLPGSWTALPSYHPESIRLHNERYADEEE